MRSKKLCALLLAASMVVVPQTVPVSAQAMVAGEQAESSYDIRLDDIVVNSDYNENQVYLKREVSSNETTVVVYDKATGAVLEEMSERSEPVVSSAVRNRSVSTYSVSDHTFMKFVTRTRKDGPIETTLELQLQIYSEGSFRQINKCVGAKIFASSSSDTTLEDATAHCVSASGKYPCVKVNYSGSGVITGAATKSLGSEFSVSALELAGYSVSCETSKTWYYRKYVQISGSYSLY